MKNSLKTTALALALVASTVGAFAANYAHLTAPKLAPVYWYDLAGNFIDSIEEPGVPTGCQLSGNDCAKGFETYQGPTTNNPGTVFAGLEN